MTNIFKGASVIVQGITGSHGRFQTKAMLAAGTSIVAGVTPGKAGELVEGIPVYNSINDAREHHDIDISVIFVPAPFAKAALVEAIAANIALVVCITEGIPVHDMLVVKRRLESSSSTLLGPNSPGALLPSINKLGIIPANLSLPGSVGIVSRSGTLTYETMAALSAKDIGQKYVIGIGGDTIHGMGYIDCLKLFQADSGVDRIVVIGEIGGKEECEAADFIASNVTKPVFAYIAGHHAPAGVQLGHAGAILGSSDESAGAKTVYLESKGIKTATSITDLINIVSAREMLY